MLRIGAFICAGNNFSHVIAQYKKSDHQLIKTGVYRFSIQFNSNVNLILLY